MAIRYLRRPPKPAKSLDPAAVRRGRRVARETEQQQSAAPVPPAVLPQERAVLAQALAYFCVACGREHVTGGVRESDICSAEAKIEAAIQGERT